MSAKQLRQAFLTVVFNKRSDKLQQKIQNQITTTLKEWEVVMYDYVNIITKLNQLTEIAEQQNRLNNVRKTLNECKELVTLGTDQFEKIWKLIEMALPISVINNSWMESIVKYADHLAQIKEALAPLLMYSSNRSIIEIVQKMLAQISDIQTKINFLTDKVNEKMVETFQSGSDVLGKNNQNDEE